MKKMYLSIVAIAASLAITPAFAEPTTVSVDSPLGVSAVSDASVIAMPAIPGGNVDYARNPDFFANASLCVSNPDGNWAIRRDGTLDTFNPERRAACAPIVNGQAAVSGNFVRGATPFIMRDGRILAWAGRDRLKGLPPIR